MMRLPGTYSLATKRNGPEPTISVTAFSAGFIASRSRMMNGGSDGADSASSTIGVGDGVSMVKVR